MTTSYEKQTGRDRFFDLLAEETRILIDPERGEIRAELAELADCMLCGSSQSNELFRKEGLRFVRCSECHLTYLNPRPNRQALERLYAVESQANDVWVDVLLSAAEEKFQLADFGALLDLIGRYCPAGRFLDVGCSVGRLLHLAQERGYDTLGIELGQRAARCARENYGLEILEETLERADLEDESFDVVTVIETLEHLPQPRDFLRHARRLLRPGGALLVGVPNGASLGVMVLQGKARTFNRNHLFFFTEETLTRLLNEEGFDVVEVATAVTVLDSILNQAQMLDPFAAPDIELLPPGLREKVRDPAARAQIEQQILDLGLGYRLRILARRR